MSDPTNLQHPSSMSEADKAALIASDPAAFDDDANGGAEGGEGGEGAGNGGSEGAGEGEGAGGVAGQGQGAGDGGSSEGGAGAEGGAEDGAAKGAGEGTGEGAGGTEGAEPKIPKARLDEVIDQRNAAEQLARRQAIELQALRDQLAAAKPPKDFKAEFSALLKQYDEGEIDQSEYEQRKYDLQRDEFEHIASVKALQTQAQTAEQAVQRTWDQEVAHWTSQNPGFFETEGNGEVMQRALASVVAFHGEDISNAELLAEASKLAFAKTGYKPPAAAAAAAPAPAPAGDPGQDLAAARRQQNAQRAADASNTPPAINGGVGGRGGPERGVDLENLKPGSFSKVLSKAEQEKLLGEGAV